MLFGSLESFDPRQCGHGGVAAALEWAKSHDLVSLEAGRHEIDGDRLFLNMNEYATKPFECCSFEAHRRYIDVQLMVRGIERIDSQDVAMCESQPFNEMADFCALSGEAAVQAVITDGTFAVYFPEDAHKPGIAVGDPAEVKKAVFKVLL